MDSQTVRREPSEAPFWLACLPLLVLIVLLALSVKLYGADSSYGPNQIALLLAGGVAGVIGLRLGLRWADIQEAMVHGVSLGTSAIFILLAVGALIGTWMLAGTVPTLINYGLVLLSPSVFYAASCLVCALVALAIGSSWTVAGTLGVALMGVAGGLGMSPAITAGAIISGAYFGDKMSPLSDTTNLAPAAAGAELFAHIRHMIWTTGPSFVIALLLFAIIGFRSTAGEVSVGDLRGQLAAQFQMGPHLLIPLLVVLLLAWRRMPAFPAIAIGALLGALFAVLFQPAATARLAGADLSGGWALFAGAWKALFAGYAGESGSEALDKLLNRGGMSSMVNTVWLVLCAMSFGAIMERTGLLARIIRGVVGAAKSVGALITTTLATAIGVNLVASDQYLAIVLTGRMYKPEYERRGLAPENLSRALEDAGTLTSPLVPWNTCGAYMAATLGVATLDYLPYAFFNLINPLIAAVMAYAGFKILKVTAELRLQSRNS
ncbi:MAG: Na+/H+ antiporter NhaC [Xanthomonadales bacterium]|jgi:NhaC family Na+:H+ antiporter|nr:Na+/H+ antiporter NhaC [Xanthomonadales bacterium]